MTDRFSQDEFPEALDIAGNDPDLREEQLRTFFREKLLKAAERCKIRGGRFLPEVNDGSSYVAYPPDTPELIEASACISKEALHQLWLDVDLPELAELSDSLMELRLILRERPADDTGDVSPFIYAMF